MDYKVLQSFYINSKGKGLTFNEGDSHSEAEIKEFITPEQLGYVLNAGFLAKEGDIPVEISQVEDTTPETPEQPPVEEEDEKETEQPQQDDKVEEDVEDKKEEITPETEQKEAEDKKEEDKAEEITDGEVDYSKLSYKELKEMAIDMGYEGKSTKKKDYLNFLKNK